MQTDQDTQTNGSLLRVEGLKKYFPVRRGFFQRPIGYIKAVDGLDLIVEKGKTFGLVGESGCGKSTVGRAVLRLLEPDSGKIVFRGQDISTKSEEEIRPLRSQMQIIFQDPFGSLNPRLSVGEAIADGLRGPGLRERSARETRITELLDIVGLPAKSSQRYPHEFSGGQRQRIGIARALAVNPALIVCDEPVSALDVSVQAQIINLLDRLQKDLGIGYLFIAHDLNVVGYFCDTVAVMYLGQIMEYAPGDVLFDNPLHPYTLALLSAVPVADPHFRRKGRLLKGDVPSPFNPPPGCKFQARCPLVEERCRHGEILLYPLGNARQVRCWKKGEGKDAGDAPVRKDDSLP